ncbi:GNAT family N-acetyltransferase [Halorhabdus sp. CBA1104]|uniref:GNAT family N-acetyltransferase n=1 Tax=Halorhabdus sp. CBA1104 TaxID=1380432 RepID=UPI0012B2EF56|nr:GNAT family N-acetyltransferase [Halorhabdus sp. CBA1104]QGN06940.1 GNAT family N-acetyltransferase [Halorhabdus sp. CBA1104]
MDVTVRAAERGDVPGLRILRSQAIEASCSDVYDRDVYADLVVGTDDPLEAWIDEDATTVLVAETPITPVSYAVFSADAGVVRGIFTSPEYEREGFGTVLLQRIEAQMGQAGAQSVRAAVPTIAFEFFEANGYEHSSATEWRGLPAETMTKSLDR